jgi:hypothetical protein
MTKRTDVRGLKVATNVALPEGLKKRRGRPASVVLGLLGASKTKYPFDKMAHELAINGKTPSFFTRQKGIASGALACLQAWMVKTGSKGLTVVTRAAEALNGDGAGYRVWLARA